MDVFEAIKRKRAIRNYRPDPLPDDVVQKILRAGRRAQSSKNTQPWHFIAISKRETLDALADMGDFTGPLRSAPFAVAIVTPDPVAHYWVMFDAGQAAAYMQLAGVELGVGSCIQTLHRPEGAGALLGFPDDLHLRMLLAFGYPADPGAFAAASRPGGRAPIEEIAHFDHW